VGEIVTEIVEGAADSGVAPGRLVVGHAQDKRSEITLGARPARRALRAAVVLSTDELSRPTEQSVGRDDGCNTGKRGLAEVRSSDGETPTLVIGETQPLALKVLAQDAILLTQVVDAEQLAALEAAGSEQDHELKNQRPAAVSRAAS
jgi:hypothetical protein